MRLVIVESPYAGKADDLPRWLRLVAGWLVRWIRTRRNVAYARAAVRDCVVRFGEAPIASHLLLTQPGILRDEVPEERTRGIEAGLAWGQPRAYVREHLPMSAFYVDYGKSTGMRLGEERAWKQGRVVVERTVPGWREPWWSRWCA